MTIFRRLKLSKLSLNLFLLICFFLPWVSIRGCEFTSEEKYIPSGPEEIYSGLSYALKDSGPFPGNLLYFAIPIFVILTITLTYLFYNKRWIGKMVVSIVQCLLGGLTVWSTYMITAFAGFLAFSEEKFGYYLAQIGLFFFIVICIVEVFFLAKMKEEN